MAVLTEQERAAGNADLMRKGVGGALSKAQLRAVYIALDEYMGLTDADANQVIPQPQRGIMSAREKADVLLDVIQRRLKAT